MTTLTQNTFDLQHPGDCLAETSFWNGRIGAFLATRKRRVRRAYDLRSLRGLDDHLLRDIGLSRDEVGGSDQILRSSSQMIRLLNSQ